MDGRSKPTRKPSMEPFYTGWQYRFPSTRHVFYGHANRYTGKENDLDPSMQGSFSEDTSESPASSRPRAVYITIFIMVLLVVAGIAAAIATAVLVSKGAKHQYTRAEVKLRVLNVVYTEALSDKTSLEFKALQNEFCSNVGSLVDKDKSTTGYEGCTVESARNGSVIIVALFYFTIQTPAPLQVAVTNIFKPSSSPTTTVSIYVIETEFVAVAVAAVEETSQDTPAVRLVPEKSPGVSLQTSSPGVSLQTSSPDVSLQTSSPDVSLQTSSPDVSLQTSSPDVSLQTSSLDAVVLTSSSDASLQTSSPDVSLQTSSPGVSLQKSSPGVSLQTSSPGVSLQTSSSDVSLETSTPDISIQTSSLDVSLQTSSPGVSLQTSSPDVSLQTSRTDAFVHTSIPDISLQTSTPDVSLQTSSPDVSLETQIPDAIVLTPSPDVSLQTSSPGVSLETSSTDATVQTSSSDVCLQTSSPDAVVQTSSSDVSLQTSSPDVSLQTSSPDVSLQTSSLDAVVQTSSPDISLETSSPDVSLRTSSSDASLQTSNPDISLQTPSPDVSLQTSSSDVSLQTSSPDVSLQTSSPDVSLQTSSPDVSLQTSSPNISLQTSSPDVSLQTSSPDVSLQTSNLDISLQTPSPDVSLETSSSDVSLQTSSPDVSLQTSSPDVSLQTSSSDVSLETPGLDVSLQTSSPDVSFQTSSPGVSLQTSTPDVSLQTSSSDVSLQTSSPGVSLETSSPDAVVQTSSPGVSLQTSTPDVSLQTSSSDVSLQTSSPGVSLETSSPDAVVQTSSPDVSLQTSSPDVSLKTSSPDISLQTSSSDLSPDAGLQTSNLGGVVQTPLSTVIIVESASPGVSNTDANLLTSPVMSDYTSTSLYPSPTTQDVSPTAIPTTSLPPPTLSMGDVSVFEGDGDVILLCQMDRSYTFSNVQFFKNDALLGQSTGISNNMTEFTYRINDPRCTDTGGYECRVVSEEGNLTTTANVTVLVRTGEPTLTLPFEIVEGRWKETSLFVCTYRQGVPPAEVYWSATLANGTTLDRLNFITKEFVAENQTDTCALEATSQFYYAFSMAWNASSICCNVKQEANTSTACGDVYVIPSDMCVNQTGKYEHPYSCQLWIDCVNDIVYIGTCPRGQCIDVQNDVCVLAPTGTTTTDPFSCKGRATGDNIPREYTHPNHCKDYYWCVNGAPINRTCQGTSFFMANATQALACTSNDSLSYCAQQRPSTTPGGNLTETETTTMGENLLTSPVMSDYTSTSLYPSPTTQDVSPTAIPTTSLPPPTLSMDDVSVFEGDGDVILLCQMDRSYTFSNVQFFKNDALLGQSTGISNNMTEFTYRINDPRCTDTGGYECRVVSEEGNFTTTANVTVLVRTGEPTLTLPFEIVEGRWKETSLFVCTYRQGVPPAEVYWSATLANGTTLDRLNFITEEFVAENQTDTCALEATSQFYYAFSMAWNASSICCNVKQEANTSTACGDVYVIPSDMCVNKTGKYEHPYSCQLWIECVNDIVYIGTCPRGQCIDVQNDVCVLGTTVAPTGTTTTDSFSCKGRATGDNIPREYTHPNHCKDYYWCVNGAPINRTCQGTSFFMANATQALACTSNYSLSYCAQQSPITIPSGTGTGTTTMDPASTPAPSSKCDCSIYTYIVRPNTYPNNCTLYYWCVNGQMTPGDCGVGQQVYYDISEASVPCTNNPTDYYCQHVEDGSIEPCS
ncbi:uncharacterized protein [Haliotis asinina]|uniref:uncharacterized protein isoform X2 n=1 Tax=Haliotis asinina TaxID=109174 RepID=UPI00353205EF